MPFKIGKIWIAWVIKISDKLNINNIPFLEFKLLCYCNCIMFSIFISISSGAPWIFHIELYQCMFATIRSTKRMEKVNSMNRCFERPIVLIKTISDIVINILPNNFNLKSLNIFKVRFIWYSITWFFEDVLFRWTSRIFHTGRSERNNWLFAIRNFIQFSRHHFQLILYFGLLHCRLFRWIRLS